MSRAGTRLNERVGPEGVRRILDDLLDKRTLARTASPAGIDYPGMRVASVKRERLVEDLVAAVEEREEAREAVARVLERETRSAARKWTALTDEGRERRLADEKLLRTKNNLGLHLYLVARSAEESLPESAVLGIQQLMALHWDIEQARQLARQNRSETKLRKQIADQEKKIRHLEGQLTKSRETEREAKRDLIRRKGELAESRMLAERLRKEAEAARDAAARNGGSRSRKSGDDAPEGLQPLARAVRRLTLQQKKLQQRIETPVAAASKSETGPVSEALSASLEAITREIAAVKREQKKGRDEQSRRLDELKSALEPPKPTKRSANTAGRNGAGQRVGIFIDVQNMHYGARKLKGKLDFDSLIEAAVGKRRLIQSTAYVVETKDIDQSAFIAMLQKRAIEVRRKPLKVRADGSMKGDWDMELAFDILDAAPNLDVVVLVSGDGDFTSLVNRVKRMGPRVEVFGFPRNTAKSLVEAADRFQPLGRKFMIYDRRRSTASGSAAERPDKSASAS